MKKYFAQLREKPEHIRKRTALTITFCVMIIVIAGWIISLQAKFSAPEQTVKLKRSTAPFAMIKNGFNSAFSEAKKEVTSEQ